MELCHNRGATPQGPLQPQPDQHARPDSCFQLGSVASRGESTSSCAPVPPSNEPRGEACTPLRPAPAGHLSRSIQRTIQYTGPQRTPTSLGAPPNPASRHSRADSWPRVSCTGGTSRRQDNEGRRQRAHSVGGENRDAQQTPVLFSGEHGTQILFSRDDEERDGVDLTAKQDCDRWNPSPSSRKMMKSGMVWISRKAGLCQLTPACLQLLQSLQRFRWGELSGDEFVGEIQLAYEEMVHWRQNLFKIPSGRAGKDFTSEVTRLLSAFAEASALEGIALKAAMTLPRPNAGKSRQRHRRQKNTRKYWSVGCGSGEKGRFSPFSKREGPSNNACCSRTHTCKVNRATRIVRPQNLLSKFTTAKREQPSATLSQASTGQQTRHPPSARAGRQDPAY